MCDAVRERDWVERHSAARYYDGSSSRADRRQPCSGCPMNGSPLGSPCLPWAASSSPPWSYVRFGKWFLPASSPLAPQLPVSGAAS
jgi:hypothetical protein